MNLNSSPLRPPLPRASYVAEIKKTCAALRNAQNIDVSGLSVIRDQVFPIRGPRRTKAMYLRSKLCISSRLMRLSARVVRRPWHGFPLALVTV